MIFLHAFFIVLFAIAHILMLTGLFRPDIALFWSKKKTRKLSMLFYSVLMTVFIILAAVVS